MYINDFVDGNGKIKSLDEFNSEFNITVAIMDFNSIVSAIPKKWKIDIKLHAKKLRNIVNKNIEYIKTHTKCTQYFYKIMLKKKIESPSKAHSKWETDLILSINEE